MAKLIVEVCKIEKITTLENAQKMEMATIKGWECLVAKGAHTAGELVVFVPPDAVLSEELVQTLKLDFLRDGGRVRTIKLRGYYSQGLVLSFPQLREAKVLTREYPEGFDVAVLLGITKYEAPVKALAGPRVEKLAEQWAKYQAKEITLRRFLAKSFAIIRDRYFKKPKLSNPEFKGYTDINNIKHYPTTFEDGEIVVITEKVHGTNFRAGSVPVKSTLLIKLLKKGTHEFVYGSHHVQKTCLSGKGWYGEDVYGQIATQYGLRDVLPQGYVLYGEIYGPKIQELTYGVNKIDVVFFDLMINGKYVDFTVFHEFCLSHGLKTVPVLYIGPYRADLLKTYTEGKTVLGDACHIREGCVVKPLNEAFDNRCGRKILKSISPEYLVTKKHDAPEEYVDDNAEFSH